MNYNIHPILVHFPIALLFLYSIIKILPFQKWIPSVSWKHIERALLVVGVLGAFAALATGETAQHLMQPNRQLVHAHSNFASIATFLYCVLLAGEVVDYVKTRYARLMEIDIIKKLFEIIQEVLGNRVISGALAFLGLIAISVTGLLGGVMVYGVSADPFAAIVLKILGISI